MFAAYIEALRQVAADRAVRAEKQLTELLIKLNVGPESEWTEVAEVLAVHPLSSAIPPERRGELFDARVREVSSREPAAVWLSILRVAWYVSKHKLQAGSMARLQCPGG